MTFITLLAMAWVMMWLLKEILPPMHELWQHDSRCSSASRALEPVATRVDANLLAMFFLRNATQYRPGSWVVSLLA